MESTLVTRDGRTLAFCEWGDPLGRPVFYLHGTPGSRFLHAGEVDHAGLGIRLITYDRPGYGRSERRPGRRVVDAVADVLTIADHLSLNALGIVGVSGGGPHALAVAAGAPDRVSRCATVAGIGPADAEDLDFYAGMDPAEVDVWRDLTGPDPDLDKVMAETQQWIDAVTADPERSPEHTASLVATFTEAFRAGTDGMLDDYLALFGPWGFDLDAVTCPITVLVAEDDTSVPPAHGYWLAERLPAPGLLLVGGGHVTPRDQEMNDLFSWVAGLRSTATT